MHAGCALSLIAIAAGMFLMAYSKKENLGNIYKYVSIVIVGCGFLSLLCGAAHCAMRCCHRGMGMHRERMMMDDDDGCMMGHMGGCGMMHHHGMMRGGCNMMQEGCGEGMGNCCPMMGGQCQQGMGGGCCDGKESCHDGMGGCDDDKGGSCPMMKGDGHMMPDKKDSVKKK